MRELLFTHSERGAEMRSFASDNTSGTCKEVMQALLEANEGYAKSYGDDELTQQLEGVFRQLFEHQDLQVFPVFTGSAANGAALSAVLRPYEAVYVCENSHMVENECGLVEFFTGAKMVNVKANKEKICFEDLKEKLHIAFTLGGHTSRPRALSVTQATEAGTLYTLAELKLLSDMARKYGLYFHMDGARFANAVARLGCAPADVTWRSGLDILSFGFTKNGAMMAEVVVIFNKALAEDFAYKRKRQGQLASKHRFLSAQILAMLKDNVWLKNAANANARAQELAVRLAAFPGIEILYPVEINMVFLTMPKPVAEHLSAHGFYFYSFPKLGENAYRLIASFDITKDDINRFVDEVKKSGSF